MADSKPTGDSNLTIPQEVMSNNYGNFNKNAVDTKSSTAYFI